MELDITQDATRKQQLVIAITAQRNVKAELVNEYNSKAASEYTKGQFKDSDLPYQIDSETENVQCGS